MAWTGLVLTVEGRNALNNAQLAGRIQFKSIVVGDGAAPVNFRTLKNLVHQLYEITDIKVDVTENGCTITADFPKVEYDYYFREIGIIVTTDEGDKLYVYDNCGEDAQYMVSSTGVETTKKRIRLALAISDVEDITVDAAEILYVAYDDYESTVKILKQGLQEESERAKSKEENLNERLLEESKRAKKEEQNLTEKLEKETDRAKIAEEGLTEKLQEESSRAQRAEENLTNSLQEEVSRAQRAEETNKNNLANHAADKANPHKVTKAQVGLGNVNNTADVNKPVSTAQQNAIDSAYQQATGYTNQKIADLIGGAPETLDTLKEVADAIKEHKDVDNALNAAIGKKANQTELDTHTGNNTIHITSQERTNWNDANTKKHTHSNKGVLDKITQALLDSWNAAYTHISDAVKHITAAERTLWNTVSNKVDKVSGKGLSSNDYTTAEKNKLAGIAANANNYAHPNTAGNKHIPAGGSSGKILRWSADGVAAWGDDNNTNYSAGNQMELSGTAFKLKDVCTTVTDWNNAATNGWYMASSAANAPVSGWCYGIAVVHNFNYLRQIVWHFATDANVSGANCDRFERVKHNGSWGSWINTSVRKAVPSNAVFTDTTYTVATQSANGLMSAADKKKLDGIATGANNYTHPNTSGNKHIPAGGFSGQILRWSADGTAVWGNDNNTTYNAATQSTNGLMSAADKKKLDGIADGANKTTVDSALSASSTNPVQNKVVKSALDGKANSSHSHNYAGSASAGGSASSAVKLDSSAGSATQPVYFKDGKPTPCTHTLGKSVPSNAVFTDTNTWRGITDSLVSSDSAVSLSAKAGKSLKDSIDTINGNLKFKQVGYSFSNINVPAQSHVNKAITSECRIDGYTLISAVVHFSTTSAAALSVTYHIFAASQFFITFINNSGGTQNCSGSVYLYYINNAIKEDIFK